MNNLLARSPLAKPVRLKASSLDPERSPVTTDNFYAVSILHPSYESVDYKEIRRDHIFTENELIRANARYFVERPVLDERAARYGLSHDQTVFGYMGVTTYTNRNGITTTRFIVRLNFSNVKGLGGGCPDVVCMFTAREVKRSLQRCEWYKDPWKRRLATWLSEIFRSRS